MKFVASRVHDPSTRDRLAKMAEAGVALLDLRDPQSAELVNIIADELPSHVAGLEDSQLRENLTNIFEDLYRFASEQQDYNKDPTQDTYFTIGPNPARYFHLEILIQSVLSHLKEVDYVRIDVSDYTAEQRAMVRDYVNELADSRVLIAGDE